MHVYAMILLCFFVTLALCAGIKSNYYCYNLLLRNWFSF